MGRKRRKDLCAKLFAGSGLSLIHILLKSKGVVYGDNGNLNTATLFVLPHGSTTRAQVGNPSETKAVTYSGELFKYTTENGVKKPLAGAELSLIHI